MNTSSEEKTIRQRKRQHQHECQSIPGKGGTGIKKKKRKGFVFLAFVIVIIMMSFLCAFAYIIINKDDKWDPSILITSSNQRDGQQEQIVMKTRAISLPAPPAASKSAALMIIAVYPNTDIRQAATWSQLECFAEEFEHIIISAPIQLKDNVTRFIKEVKESMPVIGSRLEGQFYANDRYDTGLWCDALLKGKTLEAYNINTGTYLGGSSRYDHFLLTNDSLMAVEKSNELLETLKAKHASVVSLNYWQGNNSTHPWVESPARAFSLEGVQIFADNVCSLPRLRWRNHCPHLRYVKKFGGNAMKLKRCIVEKTEFDVIDYYSPDKVHGLYLGHDEYFRTWTMNHDQQL